MAINVNYSPVGIAGQVANYAGQQQGKAAALQDALRVQGLVQNERQFNKSLQNRVQETQFRTAAQMRTQDKDLASRRQNLAAQMANQNAQIQYRQQAREREQQFNRMSRLEMVREEEGMRNRLANQDWYRQREQAQVQDEQTKQMFEWKYTQAQKRQQEDLRNKMSWVNAQTDWTDDQKADALSQLESNYLGVQPHMNPVEPPMFPPGREPGMVYEENGFRYTMRMDANGNPYADELGPVAADETRDFDNKPFRMGYGVYKQNRDGGLDTVIEPFQPDFQDIYKDAEAAYAEERNLAGEDMVPEPYSQEEMNKRFEARKKAVLDAQENYIQSVLGMEEGDAKTKGTSPPAGQSIPDQLPYGRRGGLIGPAEYENQQGRLPGQVGPDDYPELGVGRMPNERYGGEDYGWGNLERANSVADDTMADLEAAIAETNQQMGDE